MLNISLAIFIFYIVLGLVVCLQPKIFLASLFGFRDTLLENDVLDFYQLGEIIITGIVFVPLYIFSRKKISNMSDKPAILGVVNIIMAILVCLLIPFLIIRLSCSYAFSTILPKSETAFAYYTSIASLVDYVKPLLFISIIIFLCAYAIYWFDVTCSKK